jgi:hypothetical protein
MNTSAQQQGCNTTYDAPALAAFKDSLYVFGVA